MDPDMHGILPASYFLLPFSYYTIRSSSVPSKSGLLSVSALAHRRIFFSFVNCPLAHGIVMFCPAPSLTHIHCPVKHFSPVSPLNLPGKYRFGSKTSSLSAYAHVHAHPRLVLLHPANGVAQRRLQFQRHCICQSSVLRSILKPRFSLGCVLFKDWSFSIFTLPQKPYLEHVPLLFSFVGSDVKRQYISDSSLTFHYLSKALCRF
ncbi:hypothetical protein FOXYSP1_12783 [Fusarium oxysporum f. sp. phaseoli]